MTTTVNSVISTTSNDHGTGLTVYSTIALWEDATDNDLVGADQIQVGQCYNDGEFLITAQITWAGATVDSTHYRKLVAASGQSFMDAATKKGTYDVSKGVGIKTTTDYVIMLFITESYFQVKGLQFYSTLTSGGTNRGAFYAEVAPLGGLVNDCIMRTAGCTAAYLGNSVKAVNSLFIVDNPHRSAVSFAYGGTPAGLYNCTIVMPSDGAVTGSCYGVFANGSTQTAVIKNTGIFGAFTAVSNGSFDAASGFNATSFGSAPGSSNVTGLTLSSQFNAVTIAAQDFIMKSGSGMSSAGTPDSTNTANLDIFGAARSLTTPSIGANELISAGTSISPGVGTLTFTGYAPAVSQSGSQSVSPGVGSMTITGYAPTVARTTNVTLTTPVIKNNTGTVLSNETGAAINIYNSTTGALVLRKTSQTTDSSGIMTVTDGTSTLVSGTTYAYEVVLATAGRRLPVATTT